MKKILIINGHPDRESYNTQLQEAYKTGALQAGADVTEIHLGSLQFDPNLRYGYRKRMELEPDLLDAWEKIKAAQHIVWVFPVWWGSLPALMKGFFDRLFLPGLAFSYRENSMLIDKKLKGKTSRLICTMDTPVWFHNLYYQATGVRAVRSQILRFCGLKITGTTYIAPIKHIKPGGKEKGLQKVKTLGQRLC
ncbi:NAD(P)H-dependent oxidoreductase [Chitinophaga oryzae]|uniref:NAD(P)H-dependent oxidoreductase n=1 Tax=Chitinophaga oryzae TaxID=2725414 RepID=A0AAE6ZJ43_9BACT|nr:NAD(P)H-dependent oxidoreductase [Chitinophaga oryzae]QJB32649.1 NAD(P)H-dependent oxidoreductase [Chitinophaga oryzae]QJB39104.1 NAD(P)H-dependent oxidoreductase [Chitinophaga oryzae]